jgi:hypothetical protein
LYYLLIYLPIVPTLLYCVYGWRLAIRIVKKLPIKWSSVAVDLFLLGALLLASIFLKPLLVSLL